MNFPAEARFLLLLGIALMRSAEAAGQDSGANPRAGAQVQGVRIGDTYQQVLAAKGAPSGEIDLGTTRILRYPDAAVRLRDGVVTRIEAVKAEPTPEAAAAAPARPENSGPASLELKDDAIANEVRNFSRNVRALFKAEKFAELEEMSAKFIQERSVFGDGLWKIECFHEALTLSPDSPEGAWPAREVEIRKWEAQFPTSLTARIVHVRYLSDYAWLARGHLYAGSVSQQAWAIYGSRLSQAFDVLKEAHRLGGRSPMLLLTDLDVAIGQGWDPGLTSRVYQGGRDLEPEFWYDEVRMALFLLPRWYGKEGDWEAFAESELRSGSGLGAEAYARVVTSLVNYYKNIFGDTHARWPVVKEGYKIMRGKYPDSGEILSQYALLAVLAQDRDAARSAFDQMNGVADPNVWQGRDVVAYQKWAYGRP